jgi:non-heme Fe2+,alpha-ketoglutarate-dependent halogenase
MSNEESRPTITLLQFISAKSVSPTTVHWIEHCGVGARERATLSVDPPSSIGNSLRGAVMIETATRLSAQQAQFYEKNGYLFPIRVFDNTETAKFRRHFDEYTGQNQERLKELIPRERREIYALTHLMLPWAYDMVSHPKVLDAVEGVIGPDILVWDSGWFVKFARDPAFVSWHQDGAYWGLKPPKVTTAWVALSESTPENGCMQVMPGTQAVQLLQKDTYDKNNALSRGQEIARDDVDEANAVNLILAPGEMSLHHIGIAHGSKANTSDRPRIGIAIRYIAPEVIQEGSERQIVQLVRGKDKYGHFEIVEPPAEGSDSAATWEEARRRILRNIMPSAAPAN